MRGRLALPLAAILVVAAACANASSPGTSASRTIPASGGAPSSEGPVSPVVGTVTSVDPPAPPSPEATPSPLASPGKASAKPARSPTPTASPSLPPVVGFTLQTAGGETLTFVIGELDNVDDFPPESLYDRMVSQDPIRVFFAVDGPNLIVHHIEDAG